MDDMNYQFELPNHQRSIIKVIGVGGGGSNAVNYMYDQGIKDVEFVVCNTDLQALQQSPVPTKLQLGSSLTQGLGAGANPDVGAAAAQESKDDVRQLLSNSTKMVFVTAGMGGGTGTGAAPIIANIARDMDILTVGIVTAPFKFEGPKKMRQAIQGIELLRQNCDTVIVILNEKLKDVYGNLAMRKAFGHADNVLLTAAKGIAEIITVSTFINVDFEDVKTTLKNSGVALMGSAEVEGENRAQKAAEAAMSSPLLVSKDISGAKRLLLTINHSEEDELQMSEFDEITEMIREQTGEDADMIFGQGIDNSLGQALRVTIIATGFDSETKALEVLMPQAQGQKQKSFNNNNRPFDYASSTEEKQKPMVARSTGINTVPPVPTQQANDQFNVQKENVMRSSSKHEASNDFFGIKPPRLEKEQEMKSPRVIQQKLFETPKPNMPSPSMMPGYNKFSFVDDEPTQQVQKEQEQAEQKEEQQAFNPFGFSSPSLINQDQHEPKVSHVRTEESSVEHPTLNQTDVDIRQGNSARGHIDIARLNNEYSKELRPNLTDENIKQSFHLDSDNLNESQQSQEVEDLPQDRRNMNDFSIKKETKEEEKYEAPTFDNTSSDKPSLDNLNVEPEFEILNPNRVKQESDAPQYTFDLNARKDVNKETSFIKPEQTRLPEIEENPFDRLTSMPIGSIETAKTLQDKPGNLEDSEKPETAQTSEADFYNEKLKGSSIPEKSVSNKSIEESREEMEKKLKFEQLIKERMEREIVLGRNEYRSPDQHKYNEMFENPSFERKNVKFNSPPHSSQESVSRFSLTEDNKISKNNTYLHDKPD